MTSNKMNDIKNTNKKIEVSFLYVFNVFAWSSVLAFGLGYGWTTIGYGHYPLSAEGSERTEALVTVSVPKIVRKSENETFPNPLLLEGKELPYSSYTSRHWSSESSASRASLYLKSTDECDKGIDWESSCNESYEGKTQCDFEGSEALVNFEEDSEEEDGNEEDEDDEEHLPAGQHLFVDIENVDEEFLNSEVLLAKAMVDVAAKSKLTLLSYHCHSLIPSGVSCVGVLLESHVSFHTWPKKGVITIDLFTCGSGLLVPVLPIVKKLFGIPRARSEDGNEPKAPRFVWGHKLRGFRPEGTQNHLTKDFGHMISGIDEFKEEIVSVETKFQRIDIWEEKYDSFIPAEKLKQLGYITRNRVVFLDGVQQSSFYGNAAYHEALVHPAMFTHSDPKRVAIIGGGEGATLREVLKHNTVEHVKMIEIDEEMVQVSREYLPEWNRCNDIKGSADWCGDDNRADMIYGDALAWFLDNLDKADDAKEKFDIIIMDALDPQDDVPFAEVLYMHDTFFNALYNSLTDEGIMVLQLGSAPDLASPSDEQTKDSKRAYLSNSLEDVGFRSIHIYEDSHCDFGYPWTYLVAMKDSNSNALWKQNVAKIDLAIRQRLRKTHSGSPILKYFDGEAMLSYQVPSKAFEATHCHKIPKPENCKVGNMYDVSIDDLSLKRSVTDGKDSWGVFTKVDIKQGSTIGRRSASQYVHIPPLTFERMNGILKNTPKYANEVSKVTDFLELYGRQTTELGKKSYFVDSSVLALISHGDSDAHNVDHQNSHSDSLDVGKKGFPLVNNLNKRDVFDPYFDRHTPERINSPIVALTDIKSGDELLKNF